MRFLWFGLSVISSVIAWPDGAPCVHAAYESMNPLEAVEHQGGLQLTPPPYEIEVEQKCYWRNQPIALTLQGKNETVWYKGFVIQPFVWNNDQLGKRIGQIVRLDDNGSWQQQCFRFKDSATHSHDEKKKHIRMWWRVDDDSSTVQFVATVVKHQTMFWVRSVRSKPIPPCRLNRFGINDYTPPAPQMPPPVKPFKMETHRVFGGDGGLTPRAEDLIFLTTTARPLPSQLPHSSSAHMSRIIPIPNMVTVHRHSSNTATTQSTRTRQPVTQRRRILQHVPRQPSSAFRQSNIPCMDTDPLNRCRGWTNFCRSSQFHAFMSSSCRKTCGFC